MGYQDKTNINWRIGSCIPNHGYSTAIGPSTMKRCASPYSARRLPPKPGPQEQKLKPGESVFHRIPKFLSICWLSVAIHHCPLVSFSLILLPGLGPRTSQRRMRRGLLQSRAACESLRGAHLLQKLGKDWNLVGNFMI